MAITYGNACGIKKAVGETGRTIIMPHKAAIAPGVAPAYNLTVEHTVTERKCAFVPADEASVSAAILSVGVDGDRTGAVLDSVAAQCCTHKAACKVLTDRDGTRNLEVLDSCSLNVIEWSRVITYRIHEVESQGMPSTVERTAEVTNNQSIEIF